MSDGTHIEWTDASWTPFRAWGNEREALGWGCEKVSEGCQHCYAETINRRLGTGLPYSVKAVEKSGGEHYLDEKALLKPLSWKRPRRIFVSSMTDIFGEWVPFDWLDRVFAVMALTPQHTYQVLTKRPERMREYLTKPETRGRVARAMDAIRVPVIEGEEERPVPGFPGYWVTNAGRVLSAKRGGERIVLRADIGEQGHSRVTLQGPTGRVRFLVHRLVLEVWEGPPPSEDAQACHLNGNAQDNRISNLRWGSQADNWGDRTRHGNFRSYSKLSAEDVAAIRSRGASGESAYAIAKDYPVSDTQVRNILNGAQWVTEAGVEWPLANCWLGTSTENQYWADIRIPELLDTPAAVRFISAEPLLGPLQLEEYLHDSDCWARFRDPPAGLCICNEPREEHISWVIVGGESGPGARPFDLAWARSIVSQCRAAGVACFYKQGGKSNRCPHSSKGGCFECFPDELKVREMPHV